MTRLYRARSTRARDEAAHLTLLAARRRVDGKARALDGPLRLAVPAAAAREPRPLRLPAVLEARLPRARGADVLQHPQRPVGPQHAADLGQTARGIGHAAEDETAHHRVEDAVAERQRLGVALHEGHGGRAAARPRDRLARGLEPDHPPRAFVEGQVAAGPAADVEDAALCAAHEPAAPLAEA